MSSPSLPQELASTPRARVLVVDDESELVAVICEVLVKEGYAAKGLSNATAPSWSPDGIWLAYFSNDMRNPGIFIVKSDLSETRQVFAPSVTQQLSPYPVGWAPDSKWMTFALMDGTVYVVDINGERLTAITGPGNHSNPAWSR